MKLNIGFFLGSKFGKGKNFSNLTKKVAKWVNKNNHNIIFGGTETGIMRDLVVNLDKNELYSSDGLIVELSTNIYSLI